jgi:hypothetical protein
MTPLRRFAASPLLRGGTHPVAGPSPFHGCLWLVHALRVLVRSSLWITE